MMVVFSRFIIRVVSAGWAPVGNVHAFASGYATLSNFNRRFHELAGVSPTEFRRLHDAAARVNGRITMHNTRPATTPTSRRL